MEQYFTPRQLMDILHVGRSKCYELFRRPDFPCARIGKLLLISESALKQWVDGGGTADSTHDNDR